MSLLNTIFGTPKPVAPAPAQAPAPASVEANNTVPNSTTAPAQQGQAQSPLDAYKDLWQTKPDEKGNGQVLNFNKEKLREVSNQMDFTESVTPENMKALTEGGEGAVKALADILNTIGRNTYNNSVETTSHLINNALGITTKNIESNIPGYIKKATVSNNLRSENPMFNNPAVAPMLSAIETQLAAKYPDASAEEITTHAKQYLTQFAEVIAPKPTQQASTKVPAEQDFSKW